MPRPRFAPPPQIKRPKLPSMVGAAVAIEQQRKNTLDLAVLAALAEDGQEMRELIASMAMTIALGAEISAALDLHSPQTKRLHGTLRTITAMALDGCRWRKAHAPVVTQDLKTSLQLAKTHAAMGLQLVPACQALAQDILKDRLRPDAVAGAELYQQEVLP